MDLKQANLAPSTSSSRLSAQSVGGERASFESARASGTTDAPPTRGTTWGAAAIIAIFGLSFTGFGLMALVMGIQGQSTHKHNAWVGIFVGGLFTLIGLAFDAGIVAVFRVSQYQRKMGARYPGQPWMLNKAWVSGRIADDGESSAIGAWIFATLWNAIAWPAFIGALANPHVGKMIWIVALFPILGCALLIAAVYLSARRLKFGKSVFEMESVPGCVGGWVAGTIRTPGRIDVADGIHLLLQCVNRVQSGSGDNSHTSEHVLWQDEQTLGGRLPRDGIGLAVPVVFAIPSECSQTRGTARNEIIWRLTASAAQPGIDFKTTFTVPVYQLDAPPTTTVSTLSAQAAKLRLAPPPAAQRAVESHINVRKQTGGRQYFEFPWTRNLKQAITMIIMGAIFTGIGVGVGIGLQGRVFGVLFGIVGVALLLGATGWLKSRSIAVGLASIELRSSLFGLAKSRSIPLKSIADVRQDAASTVNNVQYYKIKLATTDGLTIVAAGGLTLPDAKWVTNELRAALGMQSSA